MVGYPKVVGGKSQEGIAQALSWTKTTLMLIYPLFEFVGR
jgi:hypothetical protein